MGQQRRILPAEFATWYTVRDVQRRLNYGQAWINHLCHVGALRAIRTRLGWLIDPASVDQMAAERPERRIA